MFNTLIDLGLISKTTVRRHYDMGLAFCIQRSEDSEDSEKVNAQWSYSGFMIFRRELAKEAGLDLLTMPGYSDTYVNGAIERKAPTGNWDDFEDDIKDFLLHSDCDGHLTAEQCGIIAPRLKELTDKWSDGEIGKDHDKQNALELVEAMDRCAGTNKMLIFC